MRTNPGFNIQTIPLPIIGGNSFGRYAKISTEETFNMMITTDGNGKPALVPYAGYEKLFDIGGGGEGRGLYTSTQFNHMIAVVDDGVYSISTDNSVSRLFQLATESGDVFISENQAGQIGIADGLNIYIYNYNTGVVQPTTGVDFLPSYLDYQDGYFISCGVNTTGAHPIYNQWRLSQQNDGTDWTGGATGIASAVGELQSKPDTCIATVNFNKQLFIFGRKVTEIWTDVGYTLFPYQRNNYLNIDYGCLNPATIATGSIQFGENQDLIPLICWLGINEKSGPTIMYSMGGSPSQLSTDGINFKIEQLQHPENAYGFIYRLAGHTIYQIVWPMDNLSYAIDFNTKKFFTVTDEDLNYHIAKRVAFFNNRYYFLSLNDGGLYETSAQMSKYNGAEIPRIRVLPPMRLPNASRFICNHQNITMEQGQFKETAAVLLSKSKDGGLSYGSILRKELNPFADRQNICRFWQLGSANDARFKYQFWGFDRFVITEGVAGVYQ